MLKFVLAFRWNFNISGCEKFSFLCLGKFSVFLFLGGVFFDVVMVGFWLEKDFKRCGRWCLNVAWIPVNKC